MKADIQQRFLHCIKRGDVLNSTCDEEDDSARSATVSWRKFVRHQKEGGIRTNVQSGLLLRVCHGHTDTGPLAHLTPSYAGVHPVLSPELSFFHNHRPRDWHCSKSPDGCRSEVSDPAVEAR